MAEETEPKQIEITEPVIKTGTVEFMNKAAFNNPAPDKLKRVLKAMVYTFSGLVTMVSGSDLFTGGQSKIICFTLGVCILVCGGVELGTGVKSIDEK